MLTSPTMASKVFKDHNIMFTNHDVLATGKVTTYDGCTKWWIFVWLSGEHGECGGTRVSDGVECDNKYDVGRGGRRGGEGKIRGGV
ncbi:hypothetical protein E2542_SST19770 [Spatholobus suberectus]|nr:hypothetical protein E2542_SST19770 [Spatholobus suberectus]